MLILCEDTKSSRDYLAAFPFDQNQVEIDCVGAGMNTDSLMEEAIRRHAEAKAKKEPYERIWVVFDKDDWSLHNFNRAFDLARKYDNITACWSNECFELWYLLHFDYRDTAIGRREIWTEISKRIGQKYEKADNSVFKILDPRINEALRNARHLASVNGGGSEGRRNPSTRVHELVQALLALDPAKQE